MTLFGYVRHPIDNATLKILNASWRREVRDVLDLVTIHEWWPYAEASCSGAFTTVSNWTGHDWLLEDGKLVENAKRVAFLPFKDLPRHTPRPLELALWILHKEERQLMQDHGWHIRNSGEVAGTPERYRSCIQQSRGEFSCAKPSCMKWQNAWISNRTLLSSRERKTRCRATYGPERRLAKRARRVPLLDNRRGCPGARGRKRRLSAPSPCSARARREFFDGQHIIAGLLDEAPSGTAK
jgi:hypothetical protein